MVLEGRIFRWVVLPTESGQVKKLFSTIDRDLNPLNKLERNRIFMIRRLRLDSSQIIGVRGRALEVFPIAIDIMINIISRRIVTGQSFTWSQKCLIYSISLELKRFGYPIHIYQNFSSISAIKLLNRTIIFRYFLLIYRKLINELIIFTLIRRLKNRYKSKAGKPNTVYEVLAQIPLTRSENFFSIVDLLYLFIDPKNSTIMNYRYDHSSNTLNSFCNDPLVLRVLLNLIKKLNLPPNISSTQIHIQEKDLIYNCNSKFQRIDKLLKHFEGIPQLSDAFDPHRQDDVFTLSNEEINSRRRFFELIQKEYGFLAVVEPLEIGSSFVATLRHDVDRPLKEMEVASILDFFEAHNLKSSWYFRKDTYDKSLVSRLLDLGHEIGWHVTQIGSGDNDFYNKLIKYIGPIGCTFHGGFGSDYWHGASSLEFAADLDVLYAENPLAIYDHPSYMRTRKNSTLAVMASAVRIESYPASADSHIEQLIQNRGHVIIENHPDHFGQNTIALLENLISRGGLFRTNIQHKNILDGLIDLKSKVFFKKENRKEFTITYDLPNGTLLKIVNPTSNLIISPKNSNTEEVINNSAIWTGSGIIRISLDD